MDEVSTARLGYADTQQSHYRVVVSHDGDVWVADAPALEGAHTQAGNLTRLDEAIREVIALVEDLPEGAEESIAIEYDYEGFDDVATAAAVVGQCRAEVDRAQAVLAAHTTTLTQALVARGWSVRDVAPLLGISPGRVSQLRDVPVSVDLQAVLGDVTTYIACKQSVIAHMGLVSGMTAWSQVAYPLLPGFDFTPTVPDVPPPSMRPSSDTPKLGTDRVQP